MEEADGAVSQDGAVGHFGAYLKERKMIRHPCQCLWLLLSVVFNFIVFFSGVFCINFCDFVFGFVVCIYLILVSI